MTKSERERMEEHISVYRKSDGAFLCTAPRSSLPTLTAFYADKGGVRTGPLIARALTRAEYDAPNAFSREEKI